MRLDELDQPLALPLDHRLFELAEAALVEPPAGARRLLQHHVQVHQAQAVGQLGQLLRREVGQLGEVLALRRVSAMNRSRSSSSGSGTSIAATCGLCTSRSLTSASLSAIRQNAMFTRLMCGFCAQAKKPHQPRRVAAGQRVQVAGRDEVLGVVEDQSDALPLAGLLDQVALDECIQAQQQLVRVARPGDRLAPARREKLHHRLQPLRVAAGHRPQAAAQVVAEHDVPLAEDLLAQELGQAAIAVARHPPGSE